MSSVFGILVVLLAVFNSLRSFPLNSSLNETTVTVTDPDTKTEVPEAFGNADENGEYFQGDIVVHPNEIWQTKSGIVDESKRWINKQIVYVLSDNFTTSEQDIIQTSMKMISEKTCITFQERSNESNYISVTNSPDGCYSRVGMVGGEQILNLASKCVHEAIPAHEFIHALGFHHEQSRTDRDDFVKINWENIQEGKEDIFIKYDANEVHSYGTPYDYLSLMHYGRKAFSINPQTKDTITPKNPEAVIGQRDGPSYYDIQRIKKMYNCL